MDGALLTVRSPMRRAGGGLSPVLVVIAAMFVPGCTQPNCADYHQPGCWVQPPDASDDADAAGDGTIGDSDAGTDVTDGGATDEASPATDD